MTVISIMVVIFLILLLIYFRQKRTNIFNNDRSSAILSKKSFMHLLKESFPNHKILLRNDTYMICEINHRNEFEEIVFIRISSNSKKSLRHIGRMVEARYPRFPSKSEMKSDFKNYL